MDLSIVRVDTHSLELPFRAIPQRNLDRQQPEWRHVEVVEVELATGHIGVGEDMCFYGWGTLPGDLEDRLLGESAAAIAWDTSIGGAQIAVLDALARAQGVPLHALLGEQVRERVPLAWWCIDMPAHDWRTECELAAESGYRYVKLKGRPWFDIRSQIAHLAANIPAGLSIGIDFNGTLLDANRAAPILSTLAAHDLVDKFETPIPHGDVDGNRQLRDTTDREIALHFGSAVSARTQLSTGMCDGFVVGTGSPNRLKRDGAVCAVADTPCWLQQVGTGITTAFVAHAGAVIEAATWPAVTCHHIYDVDPLIESIPVEHGTMPVPDGPGLGYDLDRTVLTEYAADRPTTPPDPPRLIETRYPDGRRLYTRGGTLRELAIAGELPYYPRGVRTRAYADDGSDRWQRLFEQTRTDPVWDS